MIKFKNPFKKQAAAGAKPAPESRGVDYVALKEAVAPERPEFIEPWTLARARLEGGAKDRGSLVARKMYNAHKARVQNQWINPMQGINSGNGTAHNAIYLYQPVNYYECYFLAQDPLFTKVFNMLSQTPFSKGGELQMPEDMSEDDVKEIEKSAQKYDLWKRVVSAVRSQYVTGGCLLYMDFGLAPAELEKPLNLDKIDCRRFKGFRHIDPINVVALDVNTVDVSAADYMQPQKWYVIGLGTVHASHFLKWEANIPELPMRPMTMYFGMPLTQLIKQDVANANMVSQGVANMVNRFRLTYLKTEETSFVTNNAAQFRAKLDFMGLVQNNYNVCPLKNTEDVTQLTTSLAGLAENVEGCYLQVSAKTNIPFTELMGKSAQGMDATGAGDRRKWYDQCRMEQQSAKPHILTMYGICAGATSKEGKFVKFEDYVFHPMEEASEKELAENIRSYAEVASKLLELGARHEDVFEWLKSFKQFHLDTVQMDEIANDDNPFDDDPNGGGVDITDEVLAKLQNEWQESKHPRDKDGRFGSGGGAQDSITVRGNELGGHNMTKEGLRAAAVDYYKKNLAGTSVNHPELGEVHFSMSGYKKPVSFSADERKLKLFPFLPEIIKQGEVIESKEDTHHRVNVTDFYTIKCPVQINGKEENVRLSVRKDNMGKLYYDHVISKPLANSDRLNESGLAKGNSYSGKTPTGNKSGGSKIDNTSIVDGELIVNLFFDEE